MDRTNTTTRNSFTLPFPASATFEFVAPSQIRISIPADSTWSTKNHWHSPDHEDCLLLHTEKGELHFSYSIKPRMGGDIFGPGDFKFKPGCWTYWSRIPKSKKREELIVLFVVRDESLYRNVCSAIMDAEKFPTLRATPLWLRSLFAVSSFSPAARKWLIEYMLYVQLQVIYYNYKYWEYHGGINALSWWQWTHPFDLGRHPTWTARLESKSQRIFSQVIQGAYYWVGIYLLGMKGDYPQYNPNFGQDLSLRKPPSIDYDKAEKFVGAKHEPKTPITFVNDGSTQRPRRLSKLLAEDSRKSPKA